MIEREADQSGERASPRALTPFTARLSVAKCQQRLLPPFA